MPEQEVANQVAGAVGTGILVVYFAILILMIVSLWKVFTKAGQPGWACIVPIYNVIVLLKIAGKPLWWILLLRRTRPAVITTPACVLWISLFSTVQCRHVASSKMPFFGMFRIVRLRMVTFVRAMPP